MPNPYFRFKQFTVFHDRCAMKVTTDSCFFGAWAAEEIRTSEFGGRKSVAGGLKVLDIGAGSGLLSLMIAQKNEAIINAVEIDKEAASQAGENIQSSPWKNRIHLYQENILSFAPPSPFDVIICNPPFYENELTSANIEKNIAHHSEELLLSEVVRVIKKQLADNGLFFLLCPAKRGEELEQLLKQNKLYALQTIILKQSVRHQPFRMMVMGTNTVAVSSSATTISVWDENQQYTPAFVSLLKDYYLYL